MTSFNESDINRASDGKFAAKTTGETDADVLNARQTPRRFDYDDMEGADLGEITDGETTRISIADVGDVTVSYGRYEDTGNEYVDASTTRALRFDTDADERDVLGAMQQSFNADSVTARGDGVYDVKFSTRMDHPFPSVDDAHYGLTHHDGLNEVNHMIETGSASKEMPRLVENYRNNLERSTTRATDAWNRVAPDRQFPHETFRSEFSESDPTVFYEHADRWAEGYAGVTSAKGENNMDLIFRSYGAEAAERDAAKEA